MWLVTGSLEVMGVGREGSKGRNLVENIPVVFDLKIRVGVCVLSQTVWQPLCYRTFFLDTTVSVFLISS